LNAASTSSYFIGEPDVADTDNVVAVVVLLELEGRPPAVVATTDGGMALPVEQPASRRPIHTVTAHPIPGFALIGPLLPVDAVACRPLEVSAAPPVWIRLVIVLDPS
jgi:hypothetical protein